MNLRLIIPLCLFLAGMFSPSLKAQDSIPKAPKPNVFQRVMNYFTGAGDTDSVPKKLSWIVLGGPHYSSEKGFGLALNGVLQFRLKGCDPSMQRSTAMAYGDVSTKGFWAVGLESDLFFPNDKRRFNVEALYRYSPLDFWGVGYEMNDDDANKTKLHQREFLFSGTMLWRVAPYFYVGPSMGVNFINSGDIDNPELLNGQSKSLHHVGVGFTLQYDSRDVITSASRGVYVRLKQLFRPKWLGNSYGFSETEFRASAYKRVWNGGVLAGDLLTVLNFGEPSWAMMARLGDSRSMRGYYSGRYRDKSLYAVQVEMRQRIWYSLGGVAWVGGGNVFHDWDSFKAHFLPNYGLGLRWAIRPNMSLRFDYGFGKKGHSGFIFSMYEAF